MKDILPDIIFKTPPVTELKGNLYKDKQIKVSMLRLDEIHPIISGNKLFKLYYFLDEASISSHKKIITFGGAFSNHLAATAFACKEMNLKSIGIVRGEKPVRLSHTLRFCLDHRMELQFVSREDYKKINEKDFLDGLKKQHSDHILIPEGGFSVKGKKGASLIWQFIDTNFTHIAMPVGTATTFAGIVNANTSAAEIIGFGVLKNLNDIGHWFNELGVGREKKFVFNNDYHFGGYAKKTDELISFINDFYLRQKIPLDFVYTGKMMFGVNDLVEKEYFSPGSRILCIHTGGLQGNNSLPHERLVF